MLYDLFSEFFSDDFGLYAPKPQNTVPNKICPTCNMSLAQFAKTGKLGCSDCYEHFRHYLASVLKSIHANTTHTGKISKKADAKIRLEREIEKLESELKAAIDKQDFERAAVVRDEIKELRAKEEK